MYLVVVVVVVILQYIDIVYSTKKSWHILIGIIIIDIVSDADTIFCRHSALHSDGYCLLTIALIMFIIRIIFPTRIAILF